MGITDEDLLRTLGKLMKQAEKLGEDIRLLEERRTEEINKINENYLPQLKVKRGELYQKMKEIQGQRTLARFGPDDEELALGKSATGISSPLTLSPEFLFAMKEVMDELGIGESLSGVPGAQGTRDCLYAVPEGCHWCTGGGGR